MSVAKTIEILAEGESVEEATEEAVREASSSVENVKHVYVDDFQAIVEDGKIARYRVNAKVTFVINS